MHAEQQSDWVGVSGESRNQVSGCGGDGGKDAVR